MILYKENGESSPPPTALESSKITSPGKIGLQELGKTLGLSEEAIGNIQNHEEKEDIIEDLYKIQQEIRKIGYTSQDIPEDIKKKIQNTLKGYGVTFILDNLNSISEARNSISEARNNQIDIAVRAVEENVQSVKDIDARIVSDELNSLKNSSPLPDVVAEKIAEKTGNTKEQILRGKGKNLSQVANLIDGYYLSSPALAENVIKQLPEDKKLEADTKFRNLRTSLNDAGIPLHQVPANKSELLYPDKSDKTKQFLNSTIASTTKNNPDTLITRTGDKLNWEGTDGRKYEIDMAVHPPRLTKSRNGLSLTYEKQPENPELAESEAGLKGARDFFGRARTEVHNHLHQGAGLYKMNLDTYSNEQLEKAFSGSEFEQYEAKLSRAVTTAEQINLQTEIRDKINNLNHGNSEGFLTKAGYEYIDAILTQRIEISEAGGMEFRPSREEDVLLGKIRGLKDIRASGEIEKYVDERKKLEAAEKKLASIKTPGVEEFDRDTDTTLSTLIDLGYDKLGQDGFDELIEAMNLKNKGTINPIELNKQPSLDKAQLQSLRELAESLRKRSGQGELIVAMQQLRQGLMDESFRGKNWDTPEKRLQFLYTKTEEKESKKTEKTPAK